MLYWCSELSPFPVIWSSWFSFRSQSFEFTGFQDAHKLRIAIICPATGSPVPVVYLLQGMAGAVGTSNFLRAFLMISFSLHILRFNEINPSQPSCILELRFFTRPVLLFLQLRVPWHYSPDFGPQMIKPGCCLPFRQSLSPDHVYPSGSFSFNIVNCVKPVKESDKSLPIDIPIIIDAAFLHFIQGRMSSALESLTLASTWWRRWSLPKWTRNHFGLHQHPEMSQSCKCGGDPSDSPRTSWWSAHRTGWSRIKVNVLRSWSPPEIFTFPSATWKMILTIFHHFWRAVTSFALSFLRGFHVSEEFYRKYFLSKLMMDSRLVFRGKKDDIQQMIQMV